MRRIVFETFASCCLVIASSTSSSAETNIIAWGSGSLSRSVTNVPNLSTNAIAIVGGNVHALALLADRTVRAWGNAGDATNVPPDLTNVVGIAAGSGHSIALRNDGTIAAWGNLPFGSTIQVPPDATNVVAVGVGTGAQHVLALRADGTVVDWGHPWTTNVPPEAFNIVSVAAGSAHSLALRSDGRVVAWGDNAFDAINVPVSATNIVAVATTWRGNLALRADGYVVSWGFDPGFGSSRKPLSNVVEVAGSGTPNFSGAGGIALRADGSVVAIDPVAPSNATNIMAIGGSGYAAMAIRAVGPPVFPLLPVRRTVAAGQRAYFRLGAVGARPLTYQWSFQGANLSGATNAVLVITNAQSVHAGPYVLSVSNALGVATSEEMILSVEPLEVIVKPVQQTIVVGSNALFAANIVGQGPFTYQWKLEGEDLVGATNSTLSLTNVALSQAGNYTVGVTNSLGGMTSRSATLFVNPLTITTPPQSQTVLAGTNVNFSVGVIGATPFAYQWYFGNMEVFGATNSTLTLSNVEPAQAGAYSIAVANDYGAVTSAAAMLTVLPLTISSQPTNVLALLWSQPSFSVSPAGQGPFSYQWLFNGTNIDAATNNPLVLPNVQLAQAGSYAVVISNAFGSASSAPAILSLRQVAVWGGMEQAKYPLGITNVVAIAAGHYHTVALRQDGTVLAWGSDDQTNIPPNVTNIVAIAAGRAHNLGLRADTTVVSWGPSYYNAGSVPPSLSNVVAVACGEYHSLALKSDGTVIAWGAGMTDSGVAPDFGQSIVPPGLSNVVAISAKGAYSLALKDDGTMVAWGANDSGQTNVPAGLSNVVAIAAGYRHGVALQLDGTIVTWGSNDYDQTNVPTGLSNVVSIAAGTWNTLALLENNQVVAWGRSDSGQTNIPTGLINVNAISGGNMHLAALLGENLPRYRMILENARIIPEGFAVSVATVCGRVYRLEYKASLSDENWMAFPLVTGTGGDLTFTSPASTGTQRYYRVRSW